MKKWAVVALLFFFVMVTAGCGDDGFGRKQAGLPEITEPYHPETAQQNGDVVLVGSRIYNSDKWETFVRNLQEGKPDKIRFTWYTDEGDPIFHELVFDGERIEYTYDNTRDKFGFPRRETTFCAGFAVDDFWGSKAWLLRGCEKAELEEMFYWPVEWSVRWRVMD